MNTYIARVDEVDALCQGLEHYIVDFYSKAFDYYRLTGHDVLEHPDKQDLVIQRVRALGVVQNIKDERVQLECELVQILDILDMLHLQWQAVKCTHFITQNRWEECCQQARARCLDILEITPLGRIQLRHFQLDELLKRGLHFEL